jgi:polyisoprenoid-binding protein YceI
MVVQSFGCYTQTQEQPINSEKSEISFTISHMGFLTVKGEFHDFSGKFVFNNGILETIACSIKVESIDTNDKTRDESLVDKAYLYAEKYPYITFISTEIKTTSIANILTGILKIKGIEKKISMPFVMIPSKEGKENITKISTELNRQDFNLHFGTMNALVGRDIKIELKIVTGE